MPCPAQALLPNREGTDKLDVGATTSQNAMPPRRKRDGGLERQDAFLAALARSNASRRALSLRVSIPFHRQYPRHDGDQGESLRDDCRVETYLTRLEQEMALLVPYLDTSRNIRQLFWMGSPASYLSLGQMSELFDLLDARFGLSGLSSRDYAIDIAPQDASVLTLRHLQALGFNRLRFKVQDDSQWSLSQPRLNPRVLIETLMEEAWRLDFSQVSVDFHCATPGQTPQSLVQALQHIIDLAPSHFSLSEGLDIPKSPSCEDEPSESRAHTLRQIAHNQLTAAGYIRLDTQDYILSPEGKSVDDSSRIDHDVLGLGLGAISHIDDQRVRTTHCLADYGAALDAGCLALVTDYADASG